MEFWSFKDLLDVKNRAQESHLTVLNVSLLVQTKVMRYGNFWIV